MFDRSKLESLCDVSITRIGDTLSCGFPQTALAVSSIRESKVRAAKDHCKSSVVIYLPLLTESCIPHDLLYILSMLTYSIVW